MSSAGVLVACARAAVVLLLALVVPAAAAPAATQPVPGDHGGAPVQVFFIYALHNASAAEATRVLTAVFRADGQGAAKPAVQVATDPATNSVIVTGTDEASTRARRILNELDSAAAGDSAKTDAKLGRIEAQLRSLLKDVQAAREQLRAAPKPQGRAEQDQPLPAPDPPRPLR